MPLKGKVELLSTEFARGWVETSNGAPTHVFATLNGEIIGAARADQDRPDLNKIAEEGGSRSFAFFILFDHTIAASEANDVSVKTVEANTVIEDSAKLKIDTAPSRQIFIFGSPRSGTSELGNTLAAQLGLPWLGEGHAAPLFAQAADALAGDITSPNGLVRFMASQKYRRYAIDRARMAYYCIHGSASFLDKTPGWPMIAAAPFLYESFPSAKFIYLQRNGISNVQSRMAKFGGNFGSHCSDWVAAVDRWEQVKPRLPHFLEIRQEEMLSEPHNVADRLSAYLEVPEKADGIATSLSKGTSERTGAGLGRPMLAETGWTAEQIAIFRRICGPTMERFGYSSDS